MFEDLILAFYLLITIVQRFFLQMQSHILWWEYLMLSVNFMCIQPLSSTRIKSSNSVLIPHKLSLSCSICDFIKHKCSFKAIIILALNSPLTFSVEGHFRNICCHYHVCGYLFLLFLFDFHHVYIVHLVCLVLHVFQ